MNKETYEKIWYITIETLLIIIAVFYAFKGQPVSTFLIFILIELRHITFILKGK